MYSFEKPPKKCPNCHSEREWHDKGRIPRAVCWGCGAVEVCRENEPEEVKQEAEQS